MARPYSGTAGKVAHCQVGMFLAYAGPRGYTLRDRELYLPCTWTDDPARLQAVGLAPDTAFATKPVLAQRMRQRALAAEMPFTWVVGDTVYGHARRLRTWREAQGLSHVLAVPRNEVLRAGVEAWAVNDMYAQLPEEAWARLSVGAGSKGPRQYDWQIRILVAPTDTAWGRYLLFRRSCSDPTAWQTYVVGAPQACDLATLGGSGGDLLAHRECLCDDQTATVLRVKLGS